MIHGVRGHLIDITVLRGRAALAALCLCLPQAAQAAENGYYLQGGAGGVFVEDTHFRGGNIDNDVDFDWGWGAGGSFGYHYSNGLRTELEASFRNNDIAAISFSSSEQGQVRASALMTNLLFDFDIMDDSRLMPYAGGGAGIAYLDYDNILPLGTGVTRSVDQVEITPALQGIVGLSYAISPGADLYASYHYLSALSPSPEASNQVEMETNYDSSTLFLGVRFALGGGDESSPAPAAAAAANNIPAAPMAPPAPPAPISRTYLVFFDWDRYDLSNEAREILRDAAGDARQGNAVAVEVRGHADRSGPDDYNMRLSQKRADSVRSYLGELGIPRDTIETKALGEKEPLVPTADGVREPQNRRAEVIYVIDLRK